MKNMKIRRNEDNTANLSHRMFVKMLETGKRQPWLRIH